MEATIEVFVKGSKSDNKDYSDPRLNDNRKYFHIWIKDGDGIHTEKDLWDSILSALRDMENGNHRMEENRFPNVMNYHWY